MSAPMSDPGGGSRPRRRSLEIFLGHRHIAQFVTRRHFPFSAFRRKIRT